MKYVIAICAVILILIISVFAQMTTGLTPDKRVGGYLLLAVSCTAMYVAWIKIINK